MKKVSDDILRNYPEKFDVKSVKAVTSLGSFYLF